MHHTAWRTAAKLTTSDAGVSLHEVASKALQAACCYDQLNVGELACMEILSRSIQMTEYRWRERIVGNSTSHDDEAFLFLGADPCRGNLCVSPRLFSHIGGEMAKEAAINKEARKAREERALLRGPKK